MEGRGFLLLETGSPKAIEVKLRKRPSDPFHKDVFYLDGQTWETARPLFEKYEETLFEDGEINFGYGSHRTYDEVFVGAYKIVTIYAVDPQKYEAALKELGIAREARIKTVWDTFTSTAPGSRHTLTDVPFSIQQVREELKSRGLRFAERRPDEGQF